MSHIKLINATQKEVILSTDINVNYLKPNENKEFKLMFYLKRFTQLITKPTCIAEDSQTSVNIIAANSVGNISHVDIIAKSLSHHDVVVCVRTMNYKQLLQKSIRCRNYKTYNSKSMNKGFSNIDWRPVFNETDINTSLNLFNKTLTETFN